MLLMIQIVRLDLFTPPTIGLLRHEDGPRMGLTRGKLLARRRRRRSRSINRWQRNNDPPELIMIFTWTPRLAPELLPMARASRYASRQLMFTLFAAGQASSDRPVKAPTPSSHEPHRAPSSRRGSLRNWISGREVRGETRNEGLRGIHF